MNSAPSSPEPPDVRALPPDQRFLVVLIDGDRYALPLSQVREVLRAVWISPLPQSPAVVMGLIDVRGRFVPVIDMRRRFGRISPPLDPGERFVMAWTGDREVALRVDSVSWFEDITGTATEQVSDVLRTAAHVAGLAHAEDGLLLVQDLSAFLTEAESAALDAAISAHDESGAVA